MRVCLCVSALFLSLPSPHPSIWIPRTAVETKYQVKHDLKKDKIAQMVTRNRNQLQFIALILI